MWFPFYRRSISGIGYNAYCHYLSMLGLKSIPADRAAHVSAIIRSLLRVRWVSVWVQWRCYVFIEIVNCLWKSRETVCSYCFTYSIVLFLASNRMYIKVWTDITTHIINKFVNNWAWMPRAIMNCIRKTRFPLSGCPSLPRELEKYQIS